MALVRRKRKRDVFLTNCWIFSANPLGLCAPPLTMTRMRFLSKISIVCWIPSQAVSSHPGCWPLACASAFSAMLTSVEVVRFGTSKSCMNIRASKIVACDEVYVAQLSLIFHMISRVRCLCDVLLVRSVRIYVGLSYLCSQNNSLFEQVFFHAGRSTLYYSRKKTCCEAQ